MAGIGLSLVDARRHELLYATLMDIVPVFRVTTTSASLDLSVGKLQIDNQTRLGPSVALMSSATRERSRFLHMQLERNMSVRSMAYWNLVSIKLGKLSVDVYEAWLYELLCFESLTQSSQTFEYDEAFDLGQVSTITGQLKDHEGTLSSLGFLSDESVIFNRIFFERLELSSFESDISMHGLSSSSLRDEESIGPISTLYAQLAEISQTSVLPDVNGHHMELPSLVKEDFTMESRDGGIRGLVWNHYHHVLMGAVIRVLVTNAIYLLDNVGKSDQQVLRKHSVDAQEASEVVKGFGQGLQKGLQNLGGNFLEGLAGAFEKPMQGARSGGLFGFIKGVGEGAVVAVSKPVVGVAQFGKIVGDALDTDERRVRVPRAVYAHRRLCNYNTSHAFALFKLNEEESTLRKAERHRDADNVRRMRRNFVTFCKTFAEKGKEDLQVGKSQAVSQQAVLIADSRIMVVGPALSQVILFSMCANDCVFVQTRPFLVGSNSTVL